MESVLVFLLSLCRSSFFA